MDTMSSDQPAAPEAMAPAPAPASPAAPIDAACGDAEADGERSDDERADDERSDGEHSADDVGLSPSYREQELQGIIEALLFVSRDPLPLEKLTAVLDGPSKETVQETVNALRQSYDREDRGIHVAELAGGYLMMTQPDCAPWITKLTTIKASAKVSRSALETLAIIAYRQPIVRAEIEELRGVETSGVLRTLIDQKLVRIVGRKDVPGRPMLYGTSRVFLRKFGLRDLRDLPPLRDFNALGREDVAELLEHDESSNGHGVLDAGGDDACVTESGERERERDEDGQPDDRDT